MNNQFSIWDMMYQTFKIKNKIRLIELFSGYGSQALALKYLGADFEHYKTCDWNLNSAIAYADIHRNELPDYGKDYCSDLTKDQVVEELMKLGISLDGKVPADLEKLKRIKEDRLRLAYNSIWWENNLVDVVRTHGKDLSIKDTKNYTYLLTYSFPCTNLSLAGKRANLKSSEEINENNVYDTDNRSNMLWQVQRILRELKEGGLEMPQVLTMENVTEVHSQQNKKFFNAWLRELERLGYTSYWKDLSATDFGLPQTRERTFVVSILNDSNGDKYNYKFPTKTPLEIRVKDIKEKNVDDKYYLSQRMVDGMKKTNYESYKFENKLIDENGVASTIISRYEGSPQCLSDKKVIEIGNYSPSGHHASRIIDTRGVAPTITENHGTICAIKDNIKTEVVKKIIESGLVKEDDIIQHSYTDGGARDIKQMIVSTNGLVPTITTRPDCLGIVVKKEK